MLRDARTPIFVWLVMATVSNTVWAQPARRIETHVASACVASAQELEPRLERALGERAMSLAASVSIDETETGYRVAISAGNASGASGTTVLMAPTCDEAVDGAVEVLALAFGRVARTPAPDAAALEPDETVEASAPTTLSARELSRDRGASDAGEATSTEASATRVTLTTGVDAGTLPQPTATLSAGIARSLSAFELRALLRYGLPVVDEMVEDALVKTSRRDFGALELRACYGAGEAFHVAACTGAEVGAVRVTERTADHGVDVDEDAVTPRLAGTLVAHLSHRAGIIEPEVELGGAAVALGRDEEAPWLVLRVAAGASIEF